MERTKAPNRLVQANKLQVLSELIGRADLASKLGVAYGTERDLYEALGYPTSLTYEDFLIRYERQDIAKAIIDRPVKATWRGLIRLVETPGKDDTPLEKSWKELNNRLKLKNKFARLDKLCGIGQYGVLLLGLDDAKNQAGFAQPVKKGGKRKLLYLKPFGEDKAKIDRYVSDTNDPRYGLPKFYKITIKDANGDRSSDVIVHYTRVIHVIGDSLESEVKGDPRLLAVFNRLMDLEKVVGGDAEMFWRGARPGYQGMVDPDYQLTDTMKQDLQDQIDEFEHNLRRILVNEGVDLKALDQQLSDPINHVDIQLQMISAVTGIPKRILTGSERGELASTQDKEEWLAFVTSRRDEHAEPNIIDPFIERCMEFGILPEGEDYAIVWEDLFVMNEKARVEVGKGRAQALREYSQNPAAEAMIPIAAFVKFFLGLTPAEMAEIEELRETEVRMELPVTEEEGSIISEEELKLTANEN